MKYFVKLFSILICMVLFFNLQTFAQEDEVDNGFDDMPDLSQATSQFDAGFGYSRIGDQNYLGFRIQPELAFGKFGLGLDVPLMFNLSDGSIRTDEFKDGVGFLRMIRYARWGVKKRDPIYIRVGDISGAYLGYGLLLNNYGNATSFEKRKFGLSYDFLFKKKYGIEGIYSDFDFSSLNLFGMRPYVRPLGDTKIPILKTLEIGASIVVDNDDTYQINTDSLDVKNTNLTQDGMMALGGDIGIWLLNNRFIRISAYAQYGRLQKNNALADSLTALTKLDDSTLTLYGFDPANKSLMTNYDASSGFSVGLDFKMNVIAKILRVDARIERQWYNDYFMPQFFDVVYEMNKDAKALTLGSTEKKRGIYGKLSVNLINKISVGGGFLLPDEITENTPAFVHLNLDASQLVEKFVLTGTYMKGGITNLSEVFSIDERSLVTVRAAYKIKPWLLAGIDYRWTFTVMEDGGFEAANQIMPYVGVSFPFGKNKSEGARSVDENEGIQY